MITDGFDQQYSSGGGAVTDVSANTGGSAGNALVEYSKKLNIPIFFLWTTTEPTDPTTNTGARGATYSLTEGEFMTNVAEQTGGAIHFVDPEHQLETQSKLLAEELRNKYLLGFKSTNDKKDDKWRKLKVTLKTSGGPKLDVSTKVKYFEPKPVK